jgi:hypothetical protein
MTPRKPFVPTLNSMERLAALEGTVGEVEAAVAELLIGLKGIAGNGAIARSPHARAITVAYQERQRARERETAA